VKSLFQLSQCDLLRVLITLVLIDQSLNLASDEFAQRRGSTRGKHLCFMNSGVIKVHGEIPTHEGHITRELRVTHEKRDMSVAVFIPATRGRVVGGAVLIPRQRSSVHDI
jgi:hypothetical protein